MLDSPPQIPFLRVLMKDFRHQAQDLAIGPVPDGVDAKLKIVIDCQLTGFTLNEWDGCQSGLSSSG
jgi:hypothetical protein